MRTRRHILILGAALGVGLAAAAHAAAPMPFSTAGFDAARQAGGPVVLHVNATWCPTCRAQKPIIEKLGDDRRFSAFKVFELDYDTEKPTMRALSAPDRSTILVFKGGKEVGRLVGDTAEPKIEALFASAL